MLLTMGYGQRWTATIINYMFTFASNFVLDWNIVSSQFRQIV